MSDVEPCCDACMQDRERLTAQLAAAEATIKRVREVAPDGIALLDRIRLSLVFEGYLGEGDYAVLDRLHAALAPEQTGDDDD